jgi:integrase
MSETNEEKRLKKLTNTKGVTVHKSSLRIQFRLPNDNAATRKSIGLAPTMHNIKVANNKLGAIKTDIQSGFYDNNPKEFWRKHFPSDVQHIKENKTISDYYDHYILLREGELGTSMQNKLKSAKTWLITHKLFELNVAELLPTHIEKAIKTSYKTLKQSTVDEYLMHFKSIIKEAVNDGTISVSPFANTRRIKADKMLNEDKKPEPFSQFELSKLLAVVNVKQTKDMIELLAWCGMRPGELKAMAWEDIDLENGLIHVKYNIDREGKLKPPKTFSSIRTIELMPRAMEVIMRQADITFNKPTILETVYYKYQKTKIVERHRVFLSREDKPYIRPELTSVPKQWQNWLIAANLTHRPPYQLRHTFASQMLMVGADITWLAGQLGHCNWGMIQKIYGKWIPNEKPDYRNELAKKLNQSQL